MAHTQDTLIQPASSPYMDFVPCVVPRGHPHFFPLCPVANPFGLASGSKALRSRPLDSFDRPSADRESRTIRCYSTEPMRPTHSCLIGSFYNNPEFDRNSCSSVFLRTTFRVFTEIYLLRARFGTRTPAQGGDSLEPFLKDPPCRSPSLAIAERLSSRFRASPFGKSKT